jgi:hypothetical protein
MAESKAGMPKEKETVLGLYVTAREACEKWKAEPGKVTVLDVGTSGASPGSIVPG